MPDNALWLIPAILSITLGIGTIITVVVTLHRAKMRELDQRHAERMAAIDKGLDPFPPQEARERADDQRVALGSGGMAGGVWSFLGWIAAAVGAAYVVYYVLEGRKHLPRVPPPERPRDGDQGL